MEWTPALVALVVVGLLAASATAQDFAAPEAGEEAVRLVLPVGGPRGSSLPVDQAVGLPPTVQDGIGPGSALQMGVDGIDSVCTAAFLLRDSATGAYYLSTAGHCLVRDPEDPTTVTGETHPEMALNRVDICIAGCLNNGLGLGTYVGLEEQDGFHPVAYAKSGGIGADFGLIRIPAELHDQLRPAMPQWGGPVGVADGATGDLVVHYGHGTLLVPGVAAVITRTPADQGRVAVHTGSDGESFSALGHVTGGDSGSGANLAEPDPVDGARGTAALGVITHSVVYAGAPIFSGTLLSHGLGMVAGDLGLVLELVGEGDPLPPGPTGEPAPPAEAASPSLAIQSPAHGAKLSTANKKLLVTGTAGTGGPFPEGMQVQVAIDDPQFGFDRRVPVRGNATWNATWDLAGEALGQHVLRARLVDADANVVAQHNVTITLTAASASSSSSSSSGAPNPTSASTSSSGAATSSATSSTRANPEGGAQPTPFGSWLVVGALVAALAVAARRRA